MLALKHKCVQCPRFRVHPKLPLLLKSNGTLLTIHDYTTLLTAANFRSNNAVDCDIFLKQDTLCLTGVHDIFVQISLALQTSVIHYFGFTCTYS